MNWKVTAVFGALLVVALAVYFFQAPGPGDPTDGPQSNKLFPDFLADRVGRIDLLRKGETVTSLERATDTVGDYWRLAPPIDKPVDLAQAREMVSGVDRFVKTGGLEPGKPETAPEVTGLLDPRLIVTFHGPDRKETVRFGGQPPTNSTAVFFQKDGDPKVYLAGQEVYAAYDKSALALRQRQLVRYNPHKVVRVELEKKFERGRKGQPASIEYERSTLERLEGADLGWWLIKPHRERLDDLKVMRLVTDLAAFPIDDWRPAGNLNAQGFAQPSDKVSLWLHGSDKPYTVLFGDDTDSKRKRFAHVEGSGEVARIDLRRYDQLPLQRNHFRPDIVFPFSRDSVKTFALESRGLGKIVIHRRETKDPQTQLPTVMWDLVEPANLKIERERIEGFVASIVGLRILDFLGAQDFKTAKLDPADVTLTLGTRDGKTHVCHFTGEFMRREGVEEVFAIQPEMVTIMRRLELNFLHREIFNVPRASISEFTFDAKSQVIYYGAKFDAPSGKWSYSKPPALAGKEPNGNVLGGVLNIMNYVQAVEFIARDPASTAEHRLEEQTAPATLTVLHEGGKAVFYISADKSDKVGRSIYFARLEGSPVIFQISSVFVEGLKKLQLRD
ncbi:MAG TPA: DUF4340 domain-containing protein [Planctomycetota bacterium]|nr:DUF4340 domain-containing protein [Planctomycetota bacterium]